MKKYIIAILCIVLLTACQKTPERNIVMPKRPIVSQQEKGNIAPQPTAYEVESHISEEFIYDNKDFTVEIDADISIPDVKEFCIYEISACEVSQCVAEKLVNVLLVDNYQVDACKWTKSQLEEYLIKYKADYVAEKDSQTAAEEEGKDYYEATVKDLERKIANAPEVIIQQTPEEHIQDFCNNKYIFLRKDMSGQAPITLRIENGHNNRFPCVLYKASTKMYSEFYIPQKEINLSLSKESAVAQSKQLMSKLGIDYMNVSTVTTGANFKSESDSNTPDNQCYLVFFTRVLDKVQVTYDYRNGEAKEDDQYFKPWAYERITIGINDSGIVQFEWKGIINSDVIKAVSRNTNLLSFDEIKTILKTNLYSSHCYNIHNKKRTCKVNDIRLGLTRVMSGDKVCRYYYVPVWDFFGEIITNNEDRKNVGSSTDTSIHSLLTINAIDGSIIDRELGY